MKKAVDRSEEARRLGYQGEKGVLVLDGKVVSHANQDWFQFCDKLKLEQKAKLARWRKQDEEWQAYCDKLEGPNDCPPLNPFL